MTEKEIFNGILNAKNLAHNVLFFEREIVDIEQNIQSNRSLASKFVDLDGKYNVDENAKRFLNNLKYNKISSKLPQSNIFKRKVGYIVIFYILNVKAHNIQFVLGELVA